MTFFDAILLGVLQGLTEFLPVSSSGHLVIGEALMGLNAPGISLEIWLHFGTLTAVLIYFRRRFFDLFKAFFRSGKNDSMKCDRTVLGAIIIGTLPAVAAGLLFKSLIESVFDSPRFAAAMLMVTGLILILTLRAGKAARRINLARGFFVGLAQMAAILPGISRSGSTIACALFLGVEPAAAAEFSFLLAAPIITLAFGYDLVFSGAALFSSDVILLYLSGTAAAFGVGILAIHYLLRIIRTGRFYLFGFYCFAAGGISFILLT